MSCVTKAMPIILLMARQLKSGNSCKTCLTNHTQSVLHHIMLLVILLMALGGVTQTGTHILTHELKQFKVTRCETACGQRVPGFKILNFTCTLSVYTNLAACHCVVPGCLHIKGNHIIFTKQLF